MDRVQHARIAIALVALSSTAHAEHDHSAPARGDADESRIVASVGALAATYRSRFYDGDYQGATFGATWTRGRYEVAMRGSFYQIDRNGRTYRGFGDVMVHGAATLVDRGRLAAGAHLMAMVPVGDEMDGLGMGHWMLMPAAWAAFSTTRATVGGSLGYARGLGDEGIHEDHGGGAAWPLVDPMSFSEITFDATAMFTLADQLRAGVRTLGAIPTGHDDTRVIGAARVSWRMGRVETTAEAQVGIAGDPVRVRGLLSTAIGF